MFEVLVRADVEDLPHNKPAPGVGNTNMAAILCPGQEVIWAGAEGHVSNSPRTDLWARRLEGGN
jgi:hypothetical protein